MYQYRNFPDVADWRRKNKQQIKIGKMFGLDVTKIRSKQMQKRGKRRNIKRKEELKKNKTWSSWNIFSLKLCKNSRKIK